MGDKNIRLLFVEDDKVDQMAFARFVRDERLPYEYTIAGSIAESKKLIASKDFDIVISDYLLGDGTLFDLIDLLKDVPVIVITGAGNEETAVSAMKSGICDYLIKDPEGRYLKILPFTVESAVKSKENEKTLKESEERLRTITENMADVVWTTDLELKITYISPSIEKLTGYSVSEYKKRKIEERHTLSSLEKMGKILEEELENEKNPRIEKDRTRALEVEVNCMNGTKITEMIVSFIRDSAGNPIGILGTERDITERKRMEAALQESESKFRGLVEASSDWIWAVDAEGVYTYASPQVEQILGYTSEEVLGKTPFDFMPLNEAKRVAGIFGAAVKAGVPIITLENICLHKDGRQIILETSGVPVTDAALKVSGYRGVDRDITYRKRAEMALQESELKHRALIKNIPGMVYRAYPDWSAEIVDGCDEISNYTTIELNSKETNWLSIIHPDDKQQVFKEGSALSMAPGDLIQTYRIIAKGGDIRWVEDRKVSLFSTDGDFLGIDGIVFDITDQKTKEAKLQQTQKSEAIGTLAGGIAHQFNNALSGITGNIDLLEMDFPGDKTIANYSEVMRTSAIRMAQLTAQLLAYAKGGKYKPETLSLSEFLQKTVPLVKQKISSPISVDRDLLGDNLNVTVDLTQMQMVLSAVLINASEAIEGKGHIRVTHQMVTFTDDTIEDFHGLKPGDYACLTINDDGQGMDEETRTRIFEPFFTTKSEGRGLGLAATYGVVKNHEGWISVDSEL